MIAFRRVEIRLVGWCFLAVGVAVHVGAQEGYAQEGYEGRLESGIRYLAASLSKELVAQGSKNVAATDFADLDGNPTELGRFLSEQLSVQLVRAKGVVILDRANLKSMLAEHKLTQLGLVNPANARKLGEFAGVDTILIGTVTLLDAERLDQERLAAQRRRQGHSYSYFERESLGPAVVLTVKAISRTILACVVARLGAAALADGANQPTFASSP